MIDSKSYFKIKISSEKNFGIVFGLIFLIIASYPLFLGKNINLWALFVSIIIFILSFFFPKYLVLPNRIWNKIGLLLGLIISPIIMLMIFVLTFLPIGLFFKLIGKDLINQKIDLKRKSYWIDRKNKLESLKKQF